jgi:hypothetical protein
MTDRQLRRQMGLSVQDGLKGRAVMLTAFWFAADQSAGQSYQA